MSWHYSSTQYMWPMLATVVFLAALSVYGWRPRLRQNYGIAAKPNMAADLDGSAGFHPEAAETEAQKFGLCFVRERAEAVGGAVRFDSAPGHGTQAVICVPLQKERS